MLPDRRHEPRFRMHPARDATLAALAAAALALLAWIPAVLATPWKGQQVQKEGATHVMNPGTGVEAPATVELKELWRLGGESESDEEFFGVISQIATDAKGNVYVLDAQLSQVKVYDSGGNFLRTVGHEGEGPGEFRRPGDMFFLPNGNLAVLQMIPGKIVLLDPQGKPAGDFPLPAPEGGGFQMLRGGRRAGNNIILVRQLQAFAQDQSKLTQTVALDRLDIAGKVLGTYTKLSRDLLLANLVIDEQQFWTFEQGGRWGVGTDGRVYVLLGGLDYAITVYKPDGTLDRVIHREYQRRKRTPEEVARIKGIWEAFTRQAPNSKVQIGDLDYDIQALYPRDDGSLWVLTGRGASDRAAGVLGVFDVLDADGKFVREVTLRGQGDPDKDGFYFVGDRLYVVTGALDAAIAMQGGGEGKAKEEDAAPMEVICYRVDAPVMAKGR